MFVASLELAPAVRPGTVVVVLDTAWTPGAAERRDIIAVRRVLASVLGRVDLFVDAQQRLDAWAAAVDAPDRLLRGGVSWWFRVCLNLAYWLHERLLWRYALAELGVGTSVREIVVPAHEVGLTQVAGILAAGGDCRVDTVGTATASPTASSANHATVAGRWRDWIGRRLRRQERLVEPACSTNGSRWRLKRSVGCSSSPSKVRRAGAGSTSTPPEWSRSSRRSSID